MARAQGFDCCLNGSCFWRFVTTSSDKKQKQNSISFDLLFRDYCHMLTCPPPASLTCMFYSPSETLSYWLWSKLELSFLFYATVCFHFEDKGVSVCRICAARKCQKLGLWHQDRNLTVFCVQRLEWGDILLCAQMSLKSRTVVSKSNRIDTYTQYYAYV